MLVLAGAVTVPPCPPSFDPAGEAHAQAQAPHCTLSTALRSFASSESAASSYAASRPLTTGLSTAPNEHRELYHSLSAVAGEIPLDGAAFHHFDSALSQSVLPPPPQTTRSRLPHRLYSNLHPPAGSHDDAFRPVAIPGVLSALSDGTTDLGPDARNLNDNVDASFHQSLKSLALDQAPASAISSSPPTWRPPTGLPSSADGLTDQHQLWGHDKLSQEKGPGTQNRGVGHQAYSSSHGVGDLCAAVSSLEEFGAFPFVGASSAIIPAHSSTLTQDRLRHAMEGVAQQLPQATKAPLLASTSPTSEIPFSRGTRQQQFSAETTSPSAVATENDPLAFPPGPPVPAATSNASAWHLASNAPSATAFHGALIHQNPNPNPNPNPESIRSPLDPRDGGSTMDALNGPPEHNPLGLWSRMPDLESWQGEMEAPWSSYAAPPIPAPWSSSQSDERIGQNRLMAWAEDCSSSLPPPRRSLGEISQQRASFSSSSPSRNEMPSIPDVSPHAPRQNFATNSTDGVSESGKALPPEDRPFLWDPLGFSQPSASSRRRVHPLDRRLSRLSSSGSSAPDVPYTMAESSSTSSSTGNARKRPIDWKLTEPSARPSRKERKRDVISTLPAVEGDPLVRPYACGVPACKLSWARLVNPQETEIRLLESVMAHTRPSARIAPFYGLKFSARGSSFSANKGALDDSNRLPTFLTGAALSRHIKHAHPEVASKLRARRREERVQRLAADRERTQPREWGGPSQRWPSSSTVRAHSGDVPTNASPAAAAQSQEVEWTHEEKQLKNAVMNSLFCCSIPGCMASYPRLESLLYHIQVAGGGTHGHGALSSENNTSAVDKHGGEADGQEARPPSSSSSLLLPALDSLTHTLPLHKERERYSSDDSASMSSDKPVSQKLDLEGMRPEALRAFLRREQARQETEQATLRKKFKHPCPFTGPATGCAPRLTPFASALLALEQTAPMEENFVRSSAIPVQLGLDVSSMEYLLPNTGQHSSDGSRSSPRHVSCGSSTALAPGQPSDGHAQAAAAPGLLVASSPSSPSHGNAQQVDVDDLTPTATASGTTSTGTTGTTTLRVSSASERSTPLSELSDEELKGIPCSKVFQQRGGLVYHLANAHTATVLRVVRICKAKFAQEESGLPPTGGGADDLLLQRAQQLGEAAPSQPPSSQSTSRSTPCSHGSSGSNNRSADELRPSSATSGAGPDSAEKPSSSPPTFAPALSTLIKYFQDDRTSYTRTIRALERAGHTI